ncbi:hypothetical protein B0T14DRAFT_565478 [Immersiella caudata]|uniref:Uncharacterized protein n=1 Tax=Immersiella caudata TaxID=314043 RepID=A0AA40C3Z4_9PEZI|nr:hypothetical protein B0T14DRAFT_565478 [Immersiella caudata]
MRPPTVITALLLPLIAHAAAIDAVLKNRTDPINGTVWTVGSGGGKTFLIYDAISGAHHNGYHGYFFTEGTGDDFYGCTELQNLDFWNRSYHRLYDSDCAKLWGVCCDGPGCEWYGTNCMSYDDPSYDMDNCDFEIHNASNIWRLEIHAHWGHFTIYEGANHVLFDADPYVIAGRCVPQPKTPAESTLRCVIKGDVFHYKQIFNCTWYDTLDDKPWTHPKVH